MRYFIEFAFNGKDYHGWQYQPNAISVQETLEKAMGLLCGENIELIAAGRTDAGVHAQQMFAHFDAVSPLDKNIVFKLNAFLPKDIAIKRLIEALPGAHARFDATRREYIYKISKLKNPFSNELAYSFFFPLDIDLMNEASSILKDYTDFQCFSKSNTDVNTYNCKIFDAFWVEEGDFLKFTISADRFLRNMVRAVVGTMIKIGSKKIEVSDLHQIIESKNRSEAGFSVPAHGLYLHKIWYPENIFKIFNDAD